MVGNSYSGNTDVHSRDIHLKNPVEVLAGISLWFGLLILLTGITGIFGWLFGGKETRKSSSLKYGAYSP